MHLLTNPVLMVQAKRVASNIATLLAENVSPEDISQVETGEGDIEPAVQAMTAEEVDNMLLECIPKKYFLRISKSADPDSFLYICALAALDAQKVPVPVTKTYVDLIQVSMADLIMGEPLTAKSQVTHLINFMYAVHVSPQEVMDLLDELGERPTFENEQWSWVTCVLSASHVFFCHELIPANTTQMLQSDNDSTTVRVPH